MIRSGRGWRREAWAAALIVPASAALGFAAIVLTPLGGWGYLLAPILAGLAAAALSRRVDATARGRAAASVGLLAVVVAAVVMAVAAVLTVLIFGL
jgi:hypothetical protein